jgi:predicted nucleic acid-binding protein
VITAVDTSVLLDVLLGDAAFATASTVALEKAASVGPLVACPVVWAEVRAALKEPEKVGELMTTVGIAFDPFDEASANLAGDLWRTYRRAGGKREHLIPDFLIGAHARARAAQLLARDRGFFRSHFSGLVVLEPEAEGR